MNEGNIKVFYKISSCIGRGKFLLNLLIPFSLPMNMKLKQGKKYEQLAIKISLKRSELLCICHDFQFFHLKSAKLLTTCSENIEVSHFLNRLNYEYFEVPKNELIWNSTGMTFFVKSCLPLAYVYVGAYGEVRKCLSKETNALRAVKIINKKYLEQTAE